MSFRITKTKAAWRDLVHEMQERAPDQNRYRFHNFSGDKLTKHQLIKLLTSSARAWNDFKRQQKHSIVWYGDDANHYWLPGYLINLRDVDLRNADLTDRDLSNVDFSGSNLSKVDFSRSRLDSRDINGTFTGYTDLTGCNLTRSKWAPSRLHYVRANNADFSHAEFNGVTLDHCQLQNAKFAKTLIAAEFDSTDIKGADFKDSYIFASSFFGMDLSAADNLNLASYHGDSRIDYQTIKLSQSVPPPLLAACGVAAFHIPYIDAISKNSAKHPSCFISYSAHDHKFIERFRNELSNNGIRTWFAPRDLSFGASTRDVIEAQIRSHDRLIVVLSKSSLQSQWVQFEVETALELERRKKGEIIIPVCIDDSPFKSRVSWARHLVRTRNIARYENWARSDSSFIREFVRRISKKTRIPKKALADTVKSVGRITSA
ncbi:toll/interleukin-1 receptor domain-containing protein [Bradyrhizobium sp. KBS0727]|uniref:toll/interleukin-1 receptor domain-containing protein n=1 Tax=unclassified Bradyrhizobium TaxID=2631580 RepID=UPI00110DF093|nr:MULTISPECIES: toll/interleukin-1 receptor domain-containing protein [unclassified Bradyrhizobium]QDW35784.1 toll/interleukin-1 receptor domain-containing protein [Bradyrhizobium sp. KBS0725]QDW42385.1 toll/interleukin-1 receptor domain-containing protein [Bradyrhizobium sp. KBS0727]